MKMMRLKSKCGKNLISGKLWSVCAGIFIAIFALVCMMGLRSVEAYADVGIISENGTWLCNGSNIGQTRYPMYKNGEGNSLLVIDNNIPSMFGTGSSIYLVSLTEEGSRILTSYYNNNAVIGKYTYTYNNTLYYIGHSTSWGQYGGVVTSYNTNGIYFENEGTNTANSAPNFEKLFSLISSYLYLLDGTPPKEPEYEQDLDLGYLLVNYKQAYNTEDEEGYIDVTYSQYTTTGVDLSQNGYGVATQIEKNYIDNSTRTVSRTMFIPVVGPIIYQLRKLRETATGVLKGIDFLYDSEQFFEDEEKSALTSYNIILRPYYYDGQDYIYGGATVIEDVDVDKVGTRMLKNYKEVDGDDVSLNQTTVYNTDFNYDITQETTYNNNEITINRFNENTYYSYTIEGDTITDNSVTNIDNSTTTINNYNDDYGGWGDLDYQFDPIETKDNIKGLLGVLVLFVPHVKNLFAYLPSWALNTFSTVFSLVAAVAVIKFLGPLAVKLLTTLVTGGTVT